MTIDRINEMHKSVISLLKNNELKKAFDIIQQLIEQEKAFGLQDKLDELQSTYQNMLRYRINGVKDPMEKKIHLGLKASASELADAVRLDILSRESSRRYYSIRRNSVNTNQLSFRELGMKLLHNEANRAVEEEANRTLFYKTWTAGLLSNIDVEELKTLMADPEIMPEAKFTTVTALMLALMEMFDKEKLLLLIEVADTAGDELKLRAFISLFISLYIWKDRMDLYPQIRNRLEALAEKDGFVRILRNVSLSFIIARDTEKVANKIREEILPEMMQIDKLVNNISASKNSIMEQLENGLNPEWEKTFSNKKFEKALDEYQKLQSEGADVMHMPFTNMKYFPFFQEMPNWFMPFTLKQVDLDKLIGNKEEEKVMGSMFYAIPLCDSDKYSLAFSLLSVSSQLRENSLGMFKSLGDQLEVTPEWKELQQDRTHKEEVGIRLYIQDLYRFYKLHPLHSEFEDIFLRDLDFHNVPLLRPYLSDVESLSTLGEYYMRKGHLKEALNIFERLVVTDESDILWQKIGYCKQMEENWQEALDAYLRSELLNAKTGKWLVSHIAVCYRALNKPEMALTYYQRYEVEHPDDLSIQISIGNCYLSLKEYNEALKYFFKVEYLDTKSHKAWRPIAWCSLLAGKYDQARSYYRKLMEKKPAVQDYLNAGHTEWAMQHIKGAMEYYREGINKQGNIEEFFNLFQQDLPSLALLGIEKDEVIVMQEQLRYFVEGKL